MTDSRTAATTWWEDESTNWDAGDAARVVDVLTYAYDTRDKVRFMALAVSVDWVTAPPAVPIRELWKWVLRAAGGRVLDLMADVLHDDASSQFHAPLEQLLGKRLGEVHARNIARYGLPPAPASGPDSVVEALTEANPDTVDPARGELQAITAVNAGWSEPRAWVMGMLQMMRRTARIEIGGQPSGTGFLVGPNLVMTAAHVLGRNWPPPQEPKQVEVVFDYMSTPYEVTPFEIGTRVGVADYVTGSLPTPAEADGLVAGNTNWNAPLEQLDYAVLKLETAVPDSPPDAVLRGGPRGHFTLSAIDYNFSANKFYFIMEHPLGDFLKASQFYGAPRVNAEGTRFRYGGNTLPGSSGSPVLDSSGRLVGLHHYSTNNQNQGVPVSVIARELLDGPHAALFRDDGQTDATVIVGGQNTEIDPFETTNFLQRRPFVNRLPLREKMRSMAVSTDGMRVLAINGESGTGVSYSYRLASHVAERSTLCTSLKSAAPGGIRAGRIDLRNYYNTYTVDDVRVAVGTDVLMDLGIIDASTDPLAQEARDTLRLVRTIGARLKGSDKQWWLFFDGIDNLVTIKQGEVDELLHALIELAEDVQVPLRIVLAGRAAEQFTDEHTDGSADCDSVLALTRGDAEAWLRQRAHEEQHQIDGDVLEAKLSEMFPNEGPLPEPRTLARRLPATLLEVLT